MADTPKNDWKLYLSAASILSKNSDRLLLELEKQFHDIKLRDGTTVDFTAADGNSGTIDMDKIADINGDKYSMRGVLKSDWKTATVSFQSAASKAYFLDEHFDNEHQLMEPSRFADELYWAVICNVWGPAYRLNYRDEMGINFPKIERNDHGRFEPYELKFKINGYTMVGEYFQWESRWVSRGALYLSTIQEFVYDFLSKIIWTAGYLRNQPGKGITLWRVWKAIPSMHGYDLMSVSAPFQWFPNSTVSWDSTWRPDSPGRMANPGFFAGRPQSGAGYGIYGVYDRFKARRLVGLIYQPGVMVVGCVHVWGNVYRYTRGARAEFARVAGFDRTHAECVEEQCAVECLAERFGVPVL